MKTWKLVSGILSIILFVVVTFQSCAAGISNLQENGEVGGSAGVLVAIMLLAGGIVSIATRNKESKGANIAIIVLFGIGAAAGFSMAGSYKDLIIWAVWCLINAVLALVEIIKSKKSE